MLLFLLPMATAGQTPRVDDSLRAALAASDDSLSKLHNSELYSKQALAYVQSQYESEKKDYFIYGITTLFLLTLALGVIVFEVRRHRQTLRTRARELETQVRHQQAIEQTREEERNRILADLHDELGGGLSSIRIMSDILAAQGAHQLQEHDQQNHYSPEPQNRAGLQLEPPNTHLHEREMITRYARKISDISRETAQGMNTIIWALNNEHNSINDLCEYIGRFGNGFFENTPTTFHLVIPPGLPDLQLSGAHRKNLFLCVKESLHNVLKHAGAHNAWVDINIEEGYLHVTITDDGRGLPDTDPSPEPSRDPSPDPNTSPSPEPAQTTHGASPTAYPNRFGNGLKNIMRRMHEIGGHVQLEKSQGLCVRLELPLAEKT